MLRRVFSTIFYPSVTETESDASTIAHAQRAIAEQHQRVGRLCAELEDSQRAQNAAEEQNNTLKETVHTLESRLRRSERTISEAQNAVSHWHTQAMDADRLRGEADAARQEQAALLKSRTADLRGAEAFLTTADTLSGEEVCGHLDALNHDILSLAASIAEDPNLVFASESSPPVTLPPVPERLHAVIAALVSRDQSEDPTFLQLAVQHSICHHIAVVASTFSIGLLPEQANLFANLYSQVHRSCE